MPHTALNTSHILSQLKSHISAPLCSLPSMPCSPFFALKYSTYPLWSSSNVISVLKCPNKISCGTLSSQSILCKIYIMQLWFVDCCGVHLPCPHHWSWHPLRHLYEVEISGCEGRWETTSQDKRISKGSILGCTRFPHQSQKSRYKAG